VHRHLVALSCTLYQLAQFFLSCQHGCSRRYAMFNAVVLCVFLCRITVRLLGIRRLPNFWRHRSCGMISTDTASYDVQVASTLPDPAL